VYQIMIDKKLTQDTPMLPVIECSALLILMVVVFACTGFGLTGRRDKL